MVLDSMLSWLKPSRRPASTRPSRPRTFRPQCETLENRWVPTAIRNILGISTTFPVGGAGLDQVFAGGGTDDGGAGPVAMGFNVNFYGVTTNNTFVNNNGNITFNGPNDTFTPMGIAQNVMQPMIAPFFADVDTTGAGSGVTTYGTGTLCGFQVFVVDWFNVGEFPAMAPPVDTFQLILINRPDTGAGNFDIEMNYGSITWDNASSQGGVAAEAGFTNGAAGAARVSYEFPGSLNTGAFLDGGPNALISNSLGASTPGRYHFLVRNGQVQNSSNMTDITNQVGLYYPLRYAYNRRTGLNNGNLTIFSGASSGNTSCLDETGTGQTFSPITVVFKQLPTGVTVANQTGVTAAGHPYITLPNSSLTSSHPVRIPIQLRNPRRTPLSTFFQGYPMQVFAGTFDPTMA